MIRLAETDDLPQCADVVNGWIDGTPWLQRATPAEKVREMFEGALRYRIIWVIGEPVEAYLSLDPANGHIGALNCRTPGLGHGSALLETAREGRDFLSVNALMANVRAQTFWRRNGFTALGIENETLPVPLRRLRMEWSRYGS